MNLYDIPENSKIFLSKEQTCSDGSTYIIFHHTDGMYSYCTTEKGGIIHLSVMTDLKKMKGGYELNEK